MIPASRHARRALWRAQRRGYSNDSVNARLRSREKPLGDVVDRPQFFERQLQVLNQMERGITGDDSHPYLQAVTMPDLTLSNPWIPLWPPQLAPGATLRERVESTWRKLFSNMSARREWLKDEKGFASVLRSLQCMWYLAQHQSFYKPPPYPPWATLPSVALSEELRETTPSTPEIPTSIHEASGSFTPLSHYSGKEPDTRHRDPHRGKPIKVHLLNGKYPISRELFKWDSTKPIWTPEALNSNQKKKKSRVSWIDGFRWSCMDTYLKQLYAFSVGDLVNLKLLTTAEFASQVIPVVRGRYRSNISATRFKATKWNGTAVPEDKLTYRWIFHGPYTGAGGNGMGCQIKSIRATEGWLSARSPDIGNPFVVSVLASFDTVQSLRVYLNDQLVREEAPRRVREHYVMEKRLYTPLPWAIRGRIWDNFGVKPKLRKDT